MYVLFQKLFFISRSTKFSKYIIKFVIQQFKYIKYEIINRDLHCHYDNCHYITIKIREQSLSKRL